MIYQSSLHVAISITGTIATCAHMHEWLYKLLQTTVTWVHEGAWLNIIWVHYDIRTAKFSSSYSRWSKKQS